MKPNKQVEIFEGDRAKEYDDFIAQFFPSYELILESLPRLCDVQLQVVKQPNILVAGCGTGNETQKLADSNKNWMIDACDPSAEMLVQATEKLKTYTNVSLFEATVGQLDATSKYDMVTLCLVLHFLSDDGAKKDLLSEIYKCLKVGGTFILLDICGSKEEISNNFDSLEGFFRLNWSQEDIDERRERILNNLNVIDETKTLQLLNTLGFKNPIKWHQSFLLRSWLITK